MKKALLFVVIFILSAGLSFSQKYRVIHHFDSTKADGAWPQGSLIVSDSLIYGTASNGGDFGKGMIFKFNPNGSGYTKIYSFEGGKANGAHPCGSLLEVGSAFYGMTSKGGTIDSGIIYKINKDGSGFEILHSFTGGNKDGRSPQGSLINSGNTLYGVTMKGGERDYGIVFSLNSEDTNFKVLHSFDPAKLEGFHPNSSLLISGSILYGTTLWGGSRENLGTLFEINTDGSDFKILHLFQYPNSQPSGTLIKFGSFLYGMTCCGKNPGSIYKIDTSGSGFTTMHTFTFDDAVMGRSPYGSMVLLGDYLYGTTFMGGTHGFGTIFKIKKDSSDYTVMYNFSGIPVDGSSPVHNDLLLYNGFLYGMTQSGGSMDQGTIYTYSDSTMIDTCGTDSFDYFDFNVTEKIAFNGSADASRSIMRISPKVTNSTGSIYYNQPVPVASNFYTNFTFRFSEGYNDYDDGSPAGADGLAFIIQATDTKNIGTSGGGLGYTGISNSLAIEFDSYNNGLDLNENNGSHLAVMSNGKKPNTSKHNAKSQLAYTTAIPLLKADSTIYHCRIAYNFMQKQLQIWLDTTGEFKQPSLTVDSIDFGKILNLINMNKAFIGFTSSTGTSVENTDLLSWSFCYNQVQPITGIEEQMEANGDIIYPNPATDFIEISVGANGRSPLQSDVRIYDVYGQFQTTPTLSIHGEGVRIDVSGLAPGVYFVKIGEKVSKFVKI